MSVVTVLALGYLNNPELTRQAFIDNPFGEGRLYRTGDLVRFAPDGSLMFAGRADSQVKIRGFRIELGEIEQQLLGCDGVTGALVMARENADKDKLLVAYVLSTTDDSQSLTTQLQQALQVSLPAYMIPAAFVVLPK